MAERYQNGVDMAQDYFNTVRRYLMNGTGVGTMASPMNPGGFVQSMDPGLMSSNSPRGMSGMQLARGTTPSDADVLKAIEMMGGNPYLQDPRAAAIAASPGAASSTRGGQLVGSGVAASAGGMGQFQTGNPLLDQYLAMVELERLKANMVNDQRERNVDAIYKERERQADTELTAMRDRVMSEVDNWGGVQSQLNQEAADSALARQRANLASAGFDMSTHMPAFAARNARDLALVQQDLSEKKSDRKVRYDSQLTGNLAQTRAQLAGDRAAFLERPSDNGPDMSQAMQLAMQYGLSNAGQGFNGGGQGSSQNAALANIAAAAGGNRPPYFASIGVTDLFGLNGMPQAPVPQQQFAAPQLGPAQGPMQGPVRDPNGRAAMAALGVPMGLFGSGSASRAAARRAAGYTKPANGGIAPARAAQIRANQLSRQMAVAMSSPFRPY